MQMIANGCTSVYCASTRTLSRAGWSSARDDGPVTGAPPGGATARARQRVDPRKQCPRVGVTTEDTDLTTGSEMMTFAELDQEIRRNEGIFDRATSVAAAYAAGRQAAAKKRSTMMANVHQVQGYQILKNTIRATSISTADTDEGGYLKSDGTNRGISHGITRDGAHLLSVTTNGDYLLIPDDIEQAKLVCQDLADADGRPVGELIREGAERILAAVEEVQGWYANNPGAQYELDWYADKAREVLASLDATED